MGERRVNEERREEERRGRVSKRERERGKAVNGVPKSFLTFNR